MSCLYKQLSKLGDCGLGSRPWISLPCHEYCYWVMNTVTELWIILIGQLSKLLLEWYNFAVHFHGNCFSMAADFHGNWFPWQHKGTTLSPPLHVEDERWRHSSILTLPTALFKDHQEIASFPGPSPRRANQEVAIAVYLLMSTPINSSGETFTCARR